MATVTIAFETDQAKADNLVAAFGGQDELNAWGLEAAVKEALKRSEAQKIHAANTVRRDEMVTVEGSLPTRPSRVRGRQ